MVNRVTTRSMAKETVMAKFSQLFKKNSYLYGSATIMLFFMSWGIWWSFFQIWLTSPQGGIQLNGSQVGTVYAINGAGTVILMFVYGAVQDKLYLKRTLVIIVSAIMALIGPFAQFVYQPLLKNNFTLGAILGGIILATGFVGAVSLFEAYVERISRVHGFEFGQARMWGSVGYAIVALIAGFMFTVNPFINFWVGSVLGLVLLLIQIFWKTESDETQAAITPDTPSVSEMFALLKDSKVWAVIGFVFLSWTFYTVFDQQMFPDFYTTLFADQATGQQMYGVLNSIQVFLEAAMMALVPILLNKVGARNSLLLGVAVMFLRIGMCAVFDSAILISAAKLLHAIEVPLFVLGIFKYFSIHFNPALSATLYLVAWNLASQLGNIILSNPLGRVRDSIGYQPTFMIIAGVALVAAVYLLVFLKKDDQAVYRPAEPQVISPEPTK